MRCPECNNMIFPKIAPSVIVGVTHGDRLLLSKYANRSYTRYGMIAGFTEIGETVEKTVQREVMEEVGLKVKKLRYYGSQPWAFSSTQMMAFVADLDGSPKLTLQAEEIAAARWMSPEELPENADPLSIGHQMIERFRQGRL